MKKIFFITAFLLFVIILNAQESSEGTVFVAPPPLLGDSNALNIEKANFPNSPEIVALEKYIDFPVNLNTGAALVSIPIGNVPTSSFSLPISLSYNTVGIKANEKATWCGIGWSLNAGGTIFRRVHGFADDQAGGFLDEPNVPLSNSKDYINSETDRNYLDSKRTGLKDLETDIYYYNFNGKTGKFFFDNTGEIVVTPHAPLKITRSLTDADGIIYFTVIDEMGNKYFFGKHTNSYGIEDAREKTRVSRAGRDTEYTSAWHLTHIEPVNNGKTVSFKYKTEL